MKDLRYEGGQPDGLPTHPGAQSDAALIMVSLATLSMLGTALLVVGGLAFFLEEGTPLIALGRNAALAAMAAGGVLDAVASIQLVRHQRNQGRGAIRRDEDDR